MDKEQGAVLRKIDDLSFLEKLIGPKGATPEQQRAFDSTKYWLGKALNSAINREFKIAELCISTAREQAAICGVDISAKYAEIRKYYPKNS